MPYKGQLTRGIPFSIDVAGSIGDASGITVVKINQRGGVHASPTTIPVGVAVTIPEIVGPRIVRLIIQVHPPAGGRVNTRVLQGSSQFTDTCDADTELLWDVVP
jgi:hypothetical protein